MAYSDIKSKIDVIRSSVTANSITAPQVASVLTDILDYAQQYLTKVPGATSVSYNASQGSLASGNNVQQAIDTLSANLVSRLNALQTKDDAQTEKKNIDAKIATMLSSVSITPAAGRYNIAFRFADGTVVDSYFTNSADNSSVSVQGLESSDVQAALAELVGKITNLADGTFTKKGVRDEIESALTTLDDVINGVAISLAKDGRIQLDYTTVGGSEETLYVSPSATAVTFNRNGTSLTSTTVQTAIVELLSKVTDINKLLTSALTTLNGKANSAEVNTALSNLRNQLALKAAASDVLAEVNRLQAQINKKQDASTLTSLLEQLRLVAEEASQATTKANDAADLAESATSAANQAATDANTARTALLNLLNQLQLPTLAQEAEAAATHAELAALEAERAADEAEQASEAAKTLEGRVGKNEEKLSELEGKIDSKYIENDIAIGSFENGGYYLSSGNNHVLFKEGTGAYIGDIDISDYIGKKIKFYFSPRVTPSSRVCAITTETGLILESHTEGESTEEFIEFDNIPDNAKYLYLSAKSIEESKLVYLTFNEGLIERVDKIANDVTNVKENVDDNSKDIFVLQEKVGVIGQSLFGEIHLYDGSITTSGTWTPGANLGLYFMVIKVSPNQHIVLNKNDEQAASAFVRAYLKSFNGQPSDKTYSFDQVDEEDFKRKSGIANYDEIVPDDANYLLVTANYNLYPSKFEINEESVTESIDDKIKSLRREINKVEYPSYFDTELDEVVSVVRNNNALSAKNGDSFIFLTDVHYPINTGYSLALANYIKDRTNNKILHFNGDLLDANDTREEALDIFYKFFYNIKKYFGVNYRYAFGNHDFNPNLEALLTEDEVYSVALKSIENEVVNEDKKLYYYWDNVSVKIRYFVFDTKTGSLPYDQVEWFADMLDAVDDGWSVGLFLHIVGSGGEISSITKPLFDVADAFNTHSSYTTRAGKVHNYSKSSKVIFALYGHEHNDGYQYYGDSQIPVVKTAADKHVDTGKVSDVCFDVVDVDIERKRLHLVRVGRKSMAAGYVRERLFDIP